MSEKYEDLMVDIKNDGTFDMTRSELVGARVALQWLDQNRDQAPGRTMPESEMEHKCATYGSAYETGFRQAGGVVIPDPEPTNRDRLQGWLVEFAERNASCGGERGDCDLAEFLDAHGVKAPGGDDE